MSQVPQSLLFLGIIPALILLFISLKGYEGYYKDKTVFITFIAGLILGVIIVIIEAYSALIGVLFIILFPIIEQLSKTIVLNLPRFQGKKETPIYGLSLGLGFGSIFIPSSIILLDIQGNSDNISLIFSFLGTLGIILLHAATGVCIGYGIYKFKLIKYLVFSIILYLPVTVIIYSTELISFITQQNIGYLQLSILPYGLVIYWYFTTKIMPGIKDEKRIRTKKISKSSEGKS